MKPDWKDAPAWAMWLAQDKVGEWYFYEALPYAWGDQWMSPNWRSRRVSFANKNPDWKNTLEKRPEG
jgi:hypothetical protein